MQLENHMKFTLQNQQVKLQVKSQGAELCSLKRQDSDVEYLWQADPQFWPRHAPVLFPIVGKLPQSRYASEGKTFEMGQHGFARDMEFELVQHTPDRLIFALDYSEETLQRYPYRFRLQISYSLQHDVLSIIYKVKNTDAEAIYFSIGAHPAFNCPLFADEAFTDYFLCFEKPETQHRHLLEDGLFSGETEPVLNQDAELPLTHALFQEKDAVVFKHLESGRVSLRSRNHGHGVEMQFGGFPYFGIWSKGKAPFVCLEPWFGLAGKAGEQVPLQEKEGILRLLPKQKFTCCHSIRVF